MSVCFFLAIITFAPVLQPVCWRRRAKENRSKRHTHVDSGAGSQVEVERLASGDSERVDDDSRALDGVVDIVQRGDGSGTVAGSGRSDDGTGQDEECSEAEEGRHLVVVGELNSRAREDLGTLGVEHEVKTS